MRQVAILHLRQRRRPPRRVARLGDDREHRLAVELDLALGEDRIVVLADRAHVVHRHIARRQHPDNSRRRAAPRRDRPTRSPHAPGPTAPDTRAACPPAPAMSSVYSAAPVTCLCAESCRCGGMHPAADRRPRSAERPPSCHLPHQPRRLAGALEEKPLQQPARRRRPVLRRGAPVADRGEILRQRALRLGDRLRVPRLARPAPPPPSPPASASPPCRRRRSAPNAPPRPPPPPASRRPPPRYPRPAAW